MLLHACTAEAKCVQNGRYIAATWTYTQSAELPVGVFIALSRAHTFLYSHRLTPWEPSWTAFVLNKPMDKELDPRFSALKFVANQYLNSHRNTFLKTQTPHSGKAFHTQGLNALLTLLSSLWKKVLFPQGPPMEEA